MQRKWKWNALYSTKSESGNDALKSWLSCVILTSVWKLYFPTNLKNWVFCGIYWFEILKFVKETVWKMKCFRCEAKTDHFWKDNLGSVVGLALYSTSLSAFLPVSSDTLLDTACPFHLFGSWLVTISPFGGFLLTRPRLHTEQRLGGLANVHFWTNCWKNI